MKCVIFYFWILMAFNNSKILKICQIEIVATMVSLAENISIENNHGRVMCS